MDLLMLAAVLLIHGHTRRISPALHIALLLSTATNAYQHSAIPRTKKASNAPPFPSLTNTAQPTLENSASSEPIAIQSSRNPTDTCELSKSDSPEWVALPVAPSVDTVRDPSVAHLSALPNTFIASPCPLLQDPSHTPPPQSSYFSTPAAPRPYSPWPSKNYSAGCHPAPFQDQQFSSTQPGNASAQNQPVPRKYTTVLSGPPHLPIQYRPPLTSVEATPGPSSYGPPLEYGDYPPACCLSGHSSYAPSAPSHLNWPPAYPSRLSPAHHPPLRTSSPHYPHPYAPTSAYTHSSPPPSAYNSFSSVNYNSHSYSATPNDYYGRNTRDDSDYSTETVSGATSVRSSAKSSNTSTYAVEYSAPAPHFCEMNYSSPYLNMPAHPNNHPQHAIQHRSYNNNAVIPSSDVSQSQYSDCPFISGAQFSSPASPFNQSLFQSPQPLQPAMGLKKRTDASHPDAPHQPSSSKPNHPTHRLTKRHEHYPSTSLPYKKESLKINNSFYNSQTTQITQNNPEPITHTSHTPAKLTQPAAFQIFTNNAQIWEIFPRISNIHLKPPRDCVWIAYALNSPQWRSQLPCQLCRNLDISRNIFLYCDICKAYVHAWCFVQQAQSLLGDVLCRTCQYTLSPVQQRVMDAQMARGCMFALVEFINRSEPAALEIPQQGSLFTLLFVIALATVGSDTSLFLSKLNKSAHLIFCRLCTAVVSHDAGVRATIAGAVCRLILHSDSAEMLDILTGALCAGGYLLVATPVQVAAVIRSLLSSSSEVFERAPRLCGELVDALVAQGASLEVMCAIFASLVDRNIYESPAGLQVLKYFIAHLGLSGVEAEIGRGEEAYREGHPSFWAVLEREVAQKKACTIKGLGLAERIKKDSILITDIGVRGGAVPDNPECVNSNVSDSFNKAQ